MPRRLNPRHGSLQFWPRVRARRSFARIRSTGTGSKDAKPLSFAGYKVGMTHIIITDNRQHSRTKGEEILVPVTALECPPLKVASIRAYKNSPSGLQLLTEVFGPADKMLARRLVPAKKQSGDALAALEQKKDALAQVRLGVYTQPSLAGTAKKTPEVFEVALGGDAAAQLEFAKGVLGKELKINDVIAEGQQVDTFAVTTGKGFQGATARFGTTLRQHKSEKGTRGPANVGAWTGNRSWTIAHPGQMGFHQRMERNKWVVRISDKPDELKLKGGFVRYGVPRATILLLKGSVQGTKKRLIRFAPASRPNKLVPSQAPSIEIISTHSQQGNRA